MRRRAAWATAAIVAALLMSGCAGSGRPGDPLGNLTYRGIYEQPITLKDGVFDGEPFVSGGASRPRVQIVPPPRASGDLRGDGSAYTAVLLIENAGGSGVNTYLAIVSWRGNLPVNVATRRIGDRVRVRALAIRDRAVVLDYLGPGPGDPLCCPTVMMRKVFRLEGESLDEVDPFEVGRVPPR